MTRRQRKPTVLFTCGSLNQTTQLHAVARELPEVEARFTPFYGGRLVTGLRDLGLIENTIGGRTLRARCLAYLHDHGLAVDCDGRGSDFDMVVSCTDLVTPKNVRGKPRIVVQEGMTDPDTAASWLIRKTGRVLPLWLAGTSLTGLSGCYDRFCVASEGYRDFFVDRGAPADRIRVTGIPNFDNCVAYCDNDIPYSGYALACTSDKRETYQRDDRRAFVERVKNLAQGRPIHFKLHPNEHRQRAIAEIERWCPGATIHTETSAERLVANCAILVAQNSSVAYVGLALGKEVYSDLNPVHLRRCLPAQNGGRSARNIADVCREIIAQRLEEPLGPSGVPVAPEGFASTAEASA